MMTRNFLMLALAVLMTACTSVEITMPVVDDAGTGGTITTTSSNSGGEAGAGGEAPECTSDTDCAEFDSACLVFKCMVGSCFAFERDDDGDGHSSCGGSGLPESYDCDESDPSIHPGAEEVCGTGVDHNCNGELEEGCWEFCYTYQNGETHGCCELNGVFATANQPQPGQLIAYKGAEFVWYFASDGKRYNFPTTNILLSWFGSYDADQVPLDNPWMCGLVVNLPTATLLQIPIGGNATFRPGTYVTGLETDPTRYVVSQGSVLHALADDAMGTAIFGSSYQDRIRLTMDPFFVNYTVGAPLASSSDYNRAFEFATTLEQELGIAP